MDFSKHPCFSAEARHTTGRIHLPVAPKCNVQCNFCNRKFDCVNESRPGVCSTILAPDQALDYLGNVLEKVDNLAVVGIAGPGDPFANPEETLRTMELVGKKYPDKILCLATNGLGLPEYVERLSKLNVSHVTVTVNAVDPEIGAKIYSWVRLGPHTYRGVEGARVLLEKQTEAIRALKAHGITVKINTVIIPGVNDEHAEEVARYTAALGADVQNCIPLMHVEDTVFAGVKTPEAGEMQALRFRTGRHIKQMSHCARCRADAVGKLGENNTAEIETMLSEAATLKPTTEKPYVAVASMEGLFVNRHLGEATDLWIFKRGEKSADGGEGDPVLIARRNTPVPGTGDERWELLAATIADCVAVLVSGSGKSPEKVLKNHGITVIAMEGLVSDGAGAILSGREIPKVLLRTAGSCGAGTSCSGTGMGCA